MTSKIKIEQANRTVKGINHSFDFYAPHFEHKDLVKRLNALKAFKSKKNSRVASLNNSTMWLSTAPTNKSSKKSPHFVEKKSTGIFKSIDQAIDECPAKRRNNRSSTNTDFEITLVAIKKKKRTLTTSYMPNKKSLVKVKH